MQEFDAIGLHVTMKFWNYRDTTTSATQTVVGSCPKHQPMLVDMSESTWIEKGWAVMLTSLQSAGGAPEVNLRITQALKPRADHHQKFKAVLPVMLFVLKTKKKTLSSLSSKGENFLRLKLLFCEISAF